MNYYQMRRRDKEIKDKDQIKNILIKGRLCQIAMAHGDEPYLVAINYGYKNNCIYFHSAPEGRKIEMIRKNPKVCFMIYTDEQLVTGENPCKDWSMKYKSVIGYGKAIILENLLEKAEGLNIMMEHYSINGPFEFNEKNLEETTVVKIEIEEMSGKVSGY
jgi:nitroimidazol reductase NimA-like FMN-containing flavoprotein (pyridoxamine 5'-phosphate oxidase superfamily)